jgi:hypothetical protein
VYWKPLSFGKHKGRSLPWVVLHDPDWFFWAYETEDALEMMGKNQAEYVYERARHIRPPQRNGEDVTVEYVIHKPTGKFQNLKLLTRDALALPWFGQRLAVIDLRYPRGLKRYDKRGCALLMDDVKLWFFDSHSLTEACCTAFFEDDSNFVLRSATKARVA